MKVLWISCVVLWIHVLLVTRSVAGPILPEYGFNDDVPGTNDNPETGGLSFSHPTNQLNEDSEHPGQNLPSQSADGHEGDLTSPQGSEAQTGSSDPINPDFEEHDGFPHLGVGGEGELLPDSQSDGQDVDETEESHEETPEHAGLGIPQTGHSLDTDHQTGMHNIPESETLDHNVHPEERETGQSMTTTSTTTTPPERLLPNIEISDNNTITDSGDLHSNDSGLDIHPAEKILPSKPPQEDETPDSSSQLVINVSMIPNTTSSLPLTDLIHSTASVADVSDVPTVMPSSASIPWTSDSNDNSQIIESAPLSLSVSDSVGIHDGYSLSDSSGIPFHTSSTLDISPSKSDVISNHSSQGYTVSSIPTQMSGALSASEQIGTTIPLSDIVEGILSSSVYQDHSTHYSEFMDSHTVTETSLMIKPSLSSMEASLHYTGQNNTSAENSSLAVAVFPDGSEGFVIEDATSNPERTSTTSTTSKNITVASVTNTTTPSTTVRHNRTLSNFTLPTRSSKPKDSTTISVTKKATRLTDKPMGTKPSSITLFPVTTNFTGQISTPNSSLLSPATSSTKTSKLSPTVYIIIELQMKLSQFCSEKQIFITELVKVIKNNGQVDVKEKQVIFLNDDVMCSMSVSSAVDSNYVRLDLYIQDSDGKLDVRLMQDCVKYLKPGFRNDFMSKFGDKLLDVKLHPTHIQLQTNPPEQAAAKEKTSGITIVIIIASVGGFCCICLIMLQVIIHKRQHGRRMKTYIPGSGRMSIPNIDAIALGVVPKSRPNSGLWNPAMEHEEIDGTDPSNLMSFTALSNFTTDTDKQIKEFDSLTIEMPQLSSVPVGAEDKNRFANVIPFPHSRVKLKKIPREDNSDYINANFVKGYNNEHKVYIATQAPIQRTVNDFWRMVWEQQSRVILMLTAMDEQGQPRCTPYWPDSEGMEGRRQFGDYTVMLKSKDIQQEYTVSVMEIKDIENNLIREIRHFWYTSWPIDNNPEPISLVKFLLDTRPHYEDSGAPVVVHCCPGTGRTGTLIAVDICMRSFENRKKVDVLNTVYKIRHDRAGAVQTTRQYCLVYKALFEYATVVTSPRMSVSSTTNSLHHML